MRQTLNDDDLKREIFERIKTLIKLRDEVDEWNNAHSYKTNPKLAKDRENAQAAPTEEGAPRSSPETQQQAVKPSSFSSSGSSSSSSRNVALSGANPAGTSVTTGKPEKTYSAILKKASMAGEHSPAPIMTAANGFDDNVEMEGGEDTVSPVTPAAPQRDHFVPPQRGKVSGYVEQRGELQPTYDRPGRNLMCAEHYRCVHYCTRWHSPRQEAAMKHPDWPKKDEIFGNNFAHKLITREVNDRMKRIHLAMEKVIPMSLPPVHPDNPDRSTRGQTGVGNAASAAPKEHRREPTEDEKRLTAAREAKRLADEQYENCLRAKRLEEDKALSAKIASEADKPRTREMLEEEKKKEEEALQAAQRARKPSVKIIDVPLKASTVKIPKKVVPTLKKAAAEPATKPAPSALKKRQADNVSADGFVTVEPKTKKKTEATKASVKKSSAKKVSAKKTAEGKQAKPVAADPEEKMEDDASKEKGVTDEHHPEHDSEDDDPTYDPDVLEDEPDE